MASPIQNNSATEYTDMNPEFLQQHQENRQTFQMDQLIQAVSNIAIQSNLTNQVMLSFFSSHTDSIFSSMHMSFESSHFLPWFCILLNPQDIARRNLVNTNNPKLSCSQADKAWPSISLSLHTDIKACYMNKTKTVCHINSLLGEKKKHLI